MNLVLNPGTGPVEGSSLADAKVAAAQFVMAVTEGLSHVTATLDRDPEEDGDGRYGFTVTVRFADEVPGSREETVTLRLRMPGLPVEVMAGDADPPVRLYVNGSSWFWGFGVSIAAGKLIDAFDDWRRDTQPADDGTVLGAPRRVRAREVAVGQYVHRRFADGRDAGWFPVTAVRWHAADRRYDIRFARPERLVNLLKDRYRLTPNDHETVRDPVESQENTTP